MAKSPNLEELLAQMAATFDKYAKSDGDGNSLSQTELIKLAKAEFPTLCKLDNSQDVLKGIIGKMDMNGDKLVTFEEFGIFSISLLVALREIGQGR